MRKLEQQEYSIKLWYSHLLLFVVQECMVVDGGQEQSTTTALYPSPKLKVISLKNGDLFLIQLPLINKGLIYAHDTPPSEWLDRSFAPPFIQISQEVSLKVTHLSRPNKFNAVMSALDSLF